MGQRRLQKEVERLRNEVQGRYHFENIIGKSATMQKVYELVAHICDLSANVLITGESGTGKEMIARAIHFNSARANVPLAPLNCAAVPDTLLESVPFGHLGGAITDVRKDGQVP